MDSRIQCIEYSRDTTFQYQLLPSAFKIAEFPTYYCFEKWKYSRDLWNADTQTNEEWYKNRSLAVLTGISSMAGGMIALPITLCAAPITMVADIVIGIGECAFCIYKQVARDEILTIAHRKFVISPCQHLAFCLGAIVTLGSMYLFAALKFGYFSHVALIAWPLSYGFAQSAVGNLPKSLNHHSLNIFINGGVGDSSYGVYTKFADIDLKEKFGIGPSTQNISPPNSGGFQQQASKEIDPNKWKDYLKTEVQFMRSVNDASLSKDYIDFKKRLINKCLPKELLGLPEGFSKDDLNGKYHSLSLLVHPDKNQPRLKEAESLFKVLQHAKSLLEKQFEQKNNN